MNTVAAVGAAGPAGARADAVDETATALARDIELGIGRLHPFEKYLVPGSPADAGESGTYAGHPGDPRCPASRP
ncbi:hypothetical protein [Nocardia fusca]|uniref:hypothetical protein n=1 Tax=Nocardia fusca TaxID=941183 RepID=UPI000AEBC045|nr:hypothetical protein [Nocardia fusca]